MTEIEVEGICHQSQNLALSPAPAKTANLRLPGSYDQFSILLKREK
jgi:hypothetical protein